MMSGWFVVYLVRFGLGWFNLVYMGLLRVCLIGVLEGLFRVGLWFLYGWFKLYLGLVQGLLTIGLKLILI